MIEELTYDELDRNEITEEQFRQIMVIEQSSASGYSEEVMRALLQDERDDNFVCRDKDRIVAYITYNPNSKRRNGSIYMINLTVSPEYRNKGIAQNLIHTACKYYLSKGYSLPMSTSVDKDNFPAVNLYQKVGFEIREPICEIDEDDDQYIMDAELQDLDKKLTELSNQRIKQ